MKVDLENLLYFETYNQDTELQINKEGIAEEVILPKWLTAVISDVNDIVYSHDLFLIDIINNGKNVMIEQDRNSYIERTLASLNRNEVSPFTKFVLEDGFIYIESLLPMIVSREKTANDFIYNKPNEWVTKDIFVDICKKYKDLVNGTIPTYVNRNMGYYNDQYNNFVLVDNTYYNMEFKASVVLDLPFDQVIRIDRLSEWLKSFLKPSERLGIDLTLFSADFDIVKRIIEATSKDMPDDYKELVQINAKVFLKSVYNIEKIKNIDVENYKGATMGLSALWNFGITNNK